MSRQRIWQWWRKEISLFTWPLFNTSILKDSETCSVTHGITLTRCRVYTYVQRQVWREATTLRRWAVDLMTGPGNWWRGTFSPLGSGRLPANPIPPPAVCSACFCPEGLFQKMPPADHNAKRLWSQLPARTVGLPFSISPTRNTSPCHADDIQHTSRCPWELTKMKERLPSSQVASGLTQPLKLTSHSRS